MITGRPLKSSVNELAYLEVYDPFKIKDLLRRTKSIEFFKWFVAKMRFMTLKCTKQLPSTLALLTSKEI